MKGKKPNFKNAKALEQRGMQMVRGQAMPRCVVKPRVKRPRI